MPPLTRVLIIANVLIFLLQNSGYGGALVPFALWPTLDALLFSPWQVVSYAFLHGSFGHLFLNLFALYMFGGELEALWGSQRFGLTFFASVVTAALTQVAYSTLTGEIAPVVGASGGVFGLLLCYGLTFPDRRLLLIFPPIPMPAKVFVVVYGALELFLGLSGIQAGVAHFAHLGGMLGGWLMLRGYKGSTTRRF